MPLGIPIKILTSELLLGIDSLFGSRLREGVPYSGKSLILGSIDNLVVDQHRLSSLDFFPFHIDRLGCPVFGSHTQ